MKPANNKPWLRKGTSEHEEMVKRYLLNKLGSPNRTIYRIPTSTQETLLEMVKKQERTHEEEDKSRFR